tara:strand:+ start:1828 stop:2181 length:354 start_codon:yes stop_codon:yes gene_type:complete
VSKSNIFNILLIVIGIICFNVFFKDNTDYIQIYENKINDLESKVDSLHSKNTTLQQKADSLSTSIVQYDKKIQQLNSRIYVIKKETQKQLNAVDLFGDDDLERFFSNRYRQYTDSIN